MNQIDNIQKQGLNNLLHEIFDSRGFDFKEFGIAHIQHKLYGRLATLEIPDLYSYLHYLNSNPEEYIPLFDCILANQSQFFNDIDSYNFIKSNIIPKLIAKNKQEIRIWSIGCANGEEPYSIAILISEVLNSDSHNCRIFATDINESAIKIARSRCYLADKLSNLPEFIKDKYFIKYDNPHGNDLYIVSDKIRNMVIFGKHNIISDPPIPYIDIIICRNVLIYLEPIPRLRAIANICNALNYNGYLWLGPAENHINKSYYGLKPLNTKYKHLFKKVSYYQQQNFITYSDTYPTKNILSNIKTKAPLNLYLLILDKDYKITCHDKNIDKIFSQFNTQANIDSLLVEDISGKSIFDISHISNLKSKLDSIANTNSYLLIDNLEYQVSKNERILLKIIAIHLKDNFILIFLDVTNQVENNNQLQLAISALDMANKKLISTNEELKAMTKSLETINQYLQSANTEDFIELNEKLTRLNVETTVLREANELLINNINSGIIIVNKELLVKSVNSIAENILESQCKINKPISEPQLAKLVEQVSQLGIHKDYTLKLMNKCVDVSIYPILYENLIIILKERADQTC